VPDVAPRIKLLAAPNALMLLAVVLNNVKDVCVPTIVGLFIVTVPVIAPTLTAVALPPMFTVVAVALTMSKEPSVVVIPPGALIAIIPFDVMLPTPVIAKLSKLLRKLNVFSYYF
jgi:hypothetical protein